MDLDYDSGSMENEIHFEEFVAKEEPIDAEELDAEAAAHYIDNIDQIPLVYTTRLDDMIILNSNTSYLQPDEVTATILKESKPKLQKFPNDNCRRGTKKAFNAMKNKLKKIYHHRYADLETSDIKLELPDPLVEADSINGEILEDPINKSNSTYFEADPVIKCDVVDDPIKDPINESDYIYFEEDPVVTCEVIDEPISACKYSELLKLCRPCSVVLQKLDSDEVVTPVSSNIRAIGHVNDQDSTVIDFSSDDEPLITLNPKLRSKLESNNSELVYGVKAKKGLVVCKPAHKLTIDPNYQKNLIASFQNRIVADAVIEVLELYSKESSIYCYTPKGYLFEYYREKHDNIIKKMLVNSSGHNHIPIKSCCWVQRDGILQSLYPKALLYSSLRFMRHPHPCPPGECTCCCQERQFVDKPDIDFTDNDSDIPLKKAIEVKALANEIQSTIIQMNKEPRFDSTGMLRNVLENPNPRLPIRNLGVRNGLIDLALMYKKPLPTKPIKNRRLVSTELEKSQSYVIVLRNFAADERDIYELNPDGELKSYLKLTCFNNADRPDVKKLLQKTKQVNDVCCWFKRENIITKLIKSKTLHQSAVKFIRTQHKCTGSECNCCCEPAETKEVTLTDIKFPSRSKCWLKLLDTIRTPPKPYVIKPTVSSAIPPSVTPRLVSKLAPRLPPNNTPAANQVFVLDSPILVLDNRYIKPVSSYETITASPKPTTNEDCQFVGVRAAPTLGLDMNPTIQPTNQPITQPNNTTNVNGDDLSKEVNTLISSILDRFKDVRLTINSEGKVAAALNTPVSSLTTVELKVLANILSYAQSQVNSLGLNSGMSLSNIINLKVGNQQNATNAGPTAMQTGNEYLNNLFPAAHVNPSFNTATANVPGEPNLDSSMPTIPDMNNYFSKSLHTKNKEYANSFTSLLSMKQEPEDSSIGVPVIKNVFSLQDQDIKTEDEGSSAVVFCRKPANQNQRPKASNAIGNSKKRTGITNTEVTPPVTKRIKVLSPTKLTVAPLDKINSMVNSLDEPLPATQNHSLEVEGVRTEVPLSNNLRVVPMKPGFQPLRVTKPRIIREHNFKAFAPQPTIVVTPLQVPSYMENIEEPSIIGSFSAPSAATSTDDIEMPEGPIKIEQVFNEDDDCILGV